MRIGGCLLSGSPHWSTPKAVYTALDAEFHFDWDPCPLSQDGIGGLLLPWAGKRVYCNPPYGREIIEWVRRGPEAEVAVFLLPSRTDTAWFHWSLEYAQEIRFVRGRIKFGDAKYGAPFPSVVVIFRSGVEE